MKSSPSPSARLALGLAVLSSLAPSLQAQLWGVGPEVDRDIGAAFDAEATTHVEPSRIQFRVALPGPNNLGAVRFSPDGETLVALGASLTAYSWPEHEERYQVVTRHELDRNGVAAEFSADGSRLALGGSGEDQVLVVDAETGDFVDSFSTDNNGIYGLAWANRLGIVSLHSDGAVVLSRFGDEEQTPSRSRGFFGEATEFLSGEDARSREIARLPEGTQSSLSWSADGNALLAGSSDGEAPVYHVALTGAHAGEVRAVPSAHEAAVDVVIPVAPGYYASGDRDGVLTIWASRAPESPVHQVELDGEVSALRRSPDGRWLAVGFGETGFALIDLLTGELEEQEVREGRGVRSLDFSPDSRALAVASRSDEVYVFDVNPDALRSRAD